MKTTMLIDTTKGPRMVERYSFNFKPLLKFLLVLVLIMAYLATVCVLAMSNEPTIEVHCTDANILVFQEIDSGDYIAYVQLASKDQVEQIKNIPKVKVDPSVNNFRLCRTDVKHYEIRLDGEKCYVHNGNTTPPAEYNHTMTDKEIKEALEASSDEVKYLLKHLNKIFYID